MAAPWVTDCRARIDQEMGVGRWPNSSSIPVIQWKPPALVTVPASKPSRTPLRTPVPRHAISSGTRPYQVFWWMFQLGNEVNTSTPLVTASSSWIDRGS